MRYYLAVTGAFLLAVSAIADDELPDPIPLGTLLNTLAEIPPSPVPDLMPETALPADQAPAEQFDRSANYPFQYSVVMGRTSGDTYRTFQRPEIATLPVPSHGLIGIADMRNDTWYLRGIGQYVAGDPSGKSLEFFGGVHAVSVFGVRVGPAIRYTGIRERQRLYTFGESHGDYVGWKDFGALGLEAGIGRYNHSFVRAGYSYGGVRLRMDADLFINHQRVNDAADLSLTWTTTALQIAEVSGRITRSLGRHTFIIDGSAQDLRTTSWTDGTNRAQFLPDRHQIFRGQAMYYSPFHLGFWFRMHRTTDHRGAALLKGSTAFGLLLRF